VTGVPTDTGRAPLFNTVLVANRGEIAVRVLSTLRRLGIRGAAVFSDADAGARHVADADVAVRIGPAAASASYLDGAAVLAAAARVGAQAIHPGYGFLAENAGFAAACADAGVVFLGPSVEALETMGNKASAKRAAVAAGVAVVPGVDGTGMDDAAVADAARGVGLPVLLKPAAGGGGKGMRLVVAEGELLAAIASARREALSSFGDDALLVERFVTTPRHVEVQVFGDTHGTVLHLGDRECSLQRRHQKVIEEAPSVGLDEEIRMAMGRSAVAVARAVGYVGAGTVEFVVPAADPADFAFLEMNTRLQVEHPVTELITGLDLVELQLRVGAGLALGLTQEEVTLRGHAVEARVYAEDPAAGFLPTGGTVLSLREPGGRGVRVDGGIRAGSVVGSDYDPMLAKVVAHGPDRATALARLERALAETTVLGLTTNVSFLLALLEDPDVRAGRLDTGLIERSLATLVTDRAPVDLLVAAALALLPSAAGGAAGGAAPQDPWDCQDGWRPGGYAARPLLLATGDGPPVAVRVHRGRGPAAGEASWPLEVTVSDDPPRTASARREGKDLLVTVDGVARRWAVASDGEAVWLGVDGGAWRVIEVSPAAAAGAEAAAGDGALRSPMPGTVVAVGARAGDGVTAGQQVVVVEAMKMEHALVAPFDGVLADLAVAVGDSVRLGDVLARVDHLERETP